MIASSSAIVGRVGSAQRRLVVPLQRRPLRSDPRPRGPWRSRSVLRPSRRPLNIRVLPRLAPKLVRCTWRIDEARQDRASGQLHDAIGRGADPRRPPAGRGGHRPTPTPPSADPPRVWTRGGAEQGLHDVRMMPWPAGPARDVEMADVPDATVSVWRLVSFSHRPSSRRADAQARAARRTRSRSPANTTSSTQRIGGRTGQARPLVGDRQDRLGHPHGWIGPDRQTAHADTARAVRAARGVARARRRHVARPCGSPLRRWTGSTRRRRSRSPATRSASRRPPPVATDPRLLPRPTRPARARVGAGPGRGDPGSPRASPPHTRAPQNGRASSASAACPTATSNVRVAPVSLVRPREARCSHRTTWCAPGTIPETGDARSPASRRTPRMCACSTIGISRSSRACRMTRARPTQTWPRGRAVCLLGPRTSP